MASDGAKAIGIILIIVIVLSIVGVGVYYVMTYNSLVSENEQIDSQWAQVQNQYQRKIDLIPTLVATVENYQQFESETLMSIIELRSQWMNATTVEEQVNISNQLDSQLATIIVTYEEYPDLQSIYLVSNLMVELTNTENKISTERMFYNDYVRAYNSHIKKWPASWVANNNGFEERNYYA
ncbi:MAG: LemA family protein, partial [Thermoplasmata archaeon]